MTRITVLITDGFGSIGGISKFNRDLLIALCRYPATQQVIAIPRCATSTIPALPESLLYIQSGLNNKLKYFLAVLKTLLTQPKPDIVVCGHINLLPLAYLLSAVSQAPLLLILHGIEAWQPLKSKLHHLLLKHITGIVCVSKLTEQRFLNWTQLKTVTTFLLPNTVDLEKFRPGAKQPSLVQQYNLEGKTVLMTLGRLANAERFKGFDPVLELMPTLIEKIPNVVYLIVGDGPDRSRLEAKAEALGIRKQVVFTGFVSEADKADYYRLADLYVMPSKGEGFGIVYLEAMACGIPVIASSVDGSREAVRDGQLGYLVDPDNQQMTIDTILKALAESKRTVPEGLDYFSDQKFEHRCHQILKQFTNLSVQNR